MAKVVGITGLVSSGKSTVSKYIKDKGYKVFDADYEVKNLYKDNDFLLRLQNEFPGAFVNNDFDKLRLSKTVFENAEKRKKLESIIHPIIEEKCDIFIKEYINEKVIFIDIPLLFEVEWDKKCNEIILVLVNRDIQKNRYLERGGNPEIFDNIIKSQGNIGEKIAKSTYIIENNGSFEDFYKNLDEVLQKIKQF